jgi:hypothetical protein
MAPLRRAVVALAAAAVSSGCAIQFAATDEYSESFAPAGAVQVAFEGVEGDVVVRGMAVADVQIRGTRDAVGATRREAHRRLGRATLDPSFEGGSLVLSFDPPLADVGLVDLTLDRVSTLPSAMGLEADVAVGDLEIAALEGPLDVHTGDGDIDLDDPGDADVRAATDEGTVAYAFSSADFRIECDPGEDGAVLVGEALQALIDAGTVARSEQDGLVVLTSGTATKRVALAAAGGDISVSLLSRSPKMWQ